MDFKPSIIELNNKNKNKIENNNDINYIYRQNKDFSFSNEEENYNPNKVRLSKDGKQNTLESNNNIINKGEKNISLIGISKNNYNALDSNKNIILNELDINRIQEENKLLKQEIELIKSNFKLSDEKELLNKNTIQHINKIKKEKEKSYKNTIILIDEYKKRENYYKIRIKEMENEFNRKVEELLSEISTLKKELFLKNKIINELNQKIVDLNIQVLKMKNTISEKIQIIQYLSKNKNDNARINTQVNKMPYLNSCKSCNHFNFKKIDIKKEHNLKKRENSLNNLKYFSLNKNTKNHKMKINNSLKYYHNLKINDLIINNEDYSNKLNISNDDNKIPHVKKSSYYKNTIPKKINPNILKVHFLKKNNSYNDLTYNSVSSSNNKNRNKITESYNSKTNKNNNNNLIEIKNKLDKKSIKQFKINIDRNEIKKMTMFSPIPRNSDKNFNKNKEIKNNSFWLNDNNKNLKIFRKLNNQYNNTSFNSASNYKLKNESKNQRRIEINNYYLNNPSLISNSSFRNISPVSNKE